MTFSIALPKSLDTASSAAGLTSENGQKSAGFEGTDGFAELLSQLASFTPPAGQDDTAEADRQAGDLPTGKELPLAALGLPVLGNTLAAPTAIDATSAAGPKNPSIFFILPHDHGSVYTPVGSGMVMVA